MTCQTARVSAFLPPFLTGFIAAASVILNIVFWCSFLYVFVILKALIPHAEFRTWADRWILWIGEMWIECNRLITGYIRPIRWDVRGLDGLELRKSYLISANHQSWVDIVMLQSALNRRIPFLRFFLKQELAAIPLMGGAWKALDFPFMKRYSKEYLEKHPEKKGEDLETTRQACEKFRGKSISILNFLEGTRKTPEKMLEQNSPYKNLLRPKTGGLAFVIESMGDQFDSMLDVTLVYPDGVVTFWGLLSGKLDRMVLDIRKIQIPSSFLGRSYLADEKFREEVQAWVRDFWEKKDQRIEQLKLETAR